LYCHASVIRIHHRDASNNAKKSSNARYVDDHGKVAVDIFIFPDQLISSPRQPEYRRYFDTLLAMNALNVCRILASFLLAVAFASAATNHSDSVVLTKDTFEKQTEGKTVFIKFSNNIHDKELDLAWEQLAGKWVDDPQGLVGEVDCARDSVSKSWCQNDLLIDEFPTLKYGETSAGGIWLREYDINRTFTIMYNFTNRTLHEPFCSPGNLEACDAIKKMEMRIMDKMNDGHLDTAIGQHERGIQLIVDEWQRKLDYLYNLETKIKTNQALRVARMKTDLRILQECKAACLDPAWTNFACPEKNETEEALTLEGKGDNATDADGAAANTTAIGSKGGNATVADIFAAITKPSKGGNATGADDVAANTTALGSKGGNATAADIFAAITKPSKGGSATVADVFAAVAKPFGSKGGKAAEADTATEEHSEL
jgi:hypothetical protein